MNTNSLERWESYWSAQKEPHHSSASIGFYDRHALELKAMFGRQKPTSVLEIGCGTGALYERLGFNDTRYKGVDFSESMLSVFAKDHPDVNLECADGSDYCDSCKYNLIFSNGVIQYFDKAMLQRHFVQVRKMMTLDSVFVCASVPWKLQRRRFLTGELFPPYRRNILRLGKAFVRGLLRRPDQLGHWYGFTDMQELAEGNGMAAEVFPSLCYVYRFHAAMTLR